MTVRRLAALTALSICALALGGCSGVFDSSLPSPQSYVLRLPPTPAGPAAQPNAGSILLQRPEAGPGLESERIALLRSDRRFDFYAASRWAAPAPVLIENAIGDALRATGPFASVLDDAAPFAPRYSLRCTLRRFEADYTEERSSSAPTVHVELDCTLGRHRDRELLASFRAQGAARASEDHLNAVIAAFESATAAAMKELAAAASAAVANEKPPSESR